MKSIHPTIGVVYAVSACAEEGKFGTGDIVVNLHPGAEDGEIPCAERYALVARCGQPFTMTVDTAVAFQQVSNVPGTKARLCAKLTGTAGGRTVTWYLHEGQTDLHGLLLKLRTLPAKLTVVSAVTALCQGRTKVELKFDFEQNEGVV